MKPPSLDELNTARRLLNRHAPNLLGQLPAIILNRHPEMTPERLKVFERQDRADYRKKYGA